MAAAKFLDKFSFPNGNIFQRLRKASIPFRIYRGDWLPFCELLEGVDIHDDMAEYSAAAFAAECNAPDLPNFIFIEPSYDITNGYRSGNSMHPLGTVAAGDQLIGEVYNALKASAAWPSSVLVVTFDEHGGFFDHVTPPATVAPADTSAPSSAGVPPRRPGSPCP